MENLDMDYIEEFNKLEKDYKKFYNSEVKKVKLFFIYVNEYNEIYSIKSENEILVNTDLTKERLLYLIKNNQFNLLNKHRLVALLQFNIDLKHLDLKDFLSNKMKINYLTSLKILDTIKFKNSIKIMEDINSVFFIFSNISSDPHNTTKKINIKMSKSRTRRK